jgi:hypothetical protein
LTAHAHSPAVPFSIADLVLARALPGKTPASPSVVRADIGKLLPAEMTAAEFDILRSELTAAGFLAKSKFALTDAGRQRALRFLGISELPAKATWGTVLAKYLLRKAAGVPAEAVAKLNSGDKLAAFVLKRKYGLSDGAGATVSKVLEALACKQLGFPGETTLEGLLCAVVSELLESERLTKAKLITQLPLFKTELRSVKADDVRRKIVRDWVGAVLRTPTPSHPPEPPKSPEPTAPAAVVSFDLNAFAATVRALAAKSPPQHRFYDNKAFIAPLWRATQGEANFPRLSLSDFKQRLIEANSTHLIHLSHADMPQAMDAQLVSESEIKHLNATYHFVTLDGNAL